MTGEPKDNVARTAEAPLARGLTWVCVLLLVGVLALPAIQLIASPFPQSSVYGMALPGEFPAATWKGVKSGSFQRKAEVWLTKKNGLWPFFVRLSNQLYFSLFRQISGGYNGSILVAREGHFFQPMYLRSFNRTRKLKAAPLKRVPGQVRELQDALKEKGVQLITLVSPNLIALYPELVPRAFLDPTRLERKNSYDIVRPVFDEEGVNIVDAFAHFEQAKPSAPFRIFEPTGSHWNDVASCEVTAMLFENASRLMNRPLATPRCSDWKMEFPPPVADRDLLDIANLLFPSLTYRPAPVLQSVVSSGGGGEHPRVLLVGTSFLFAIQDQIERFHLAERTPLYFYFRQVREKSDAKLRGLNKQRIDWQKLISDFDIIILEVNQSSISAVGYGFVQEALKHLRKDALG